MSNDSTKATADLLQSIEKNSQAIQKLEGHLINDMQQYSSAMAHEITKLLESNSVPPNISTDIKKMHQTTMDMTIKIIESRPVSLYDFSKPSK